MSSSIPTGDIPQADRLDTVVLTAKLVSGGAQSYQAIAKGIGLVERQGRYYRRAAELLGLIERASTNTDIITPFGKKVVASGDKWKDLLAPRVSSLQAVQPVLGILAANPTASMRSLMMALAAATQTTGGMVERRISTVLAWLDAVGLIKINNSTVSVQSLPQTVIELPDQTPILPKLSDLKPYEEVPKRLKKAHSTVTYEVDEVKRERGSEAHERLRGLVSRNITAKCSVTSSSNKLIDLAARIGGVDHIIEIKSTTASNVRSQIRRGVAQLYEYRYLYGATSSTLTLAIENPLTEEYEWLKDYLNNDRHIQLIWDASDEELFTTPEGKKALPFV